VIVDPEVFVNFKMIDLGEGKPEELRKPRARSVLPLETPFAQFMTPPAELPVTTKAPVVPRAFVVTVVPLFQSVPILKPAGRVAAEESSIPPKSSVKGTPRDVILFAVNIGTMFGLSLEAI